MLPFTKMQGLGNDFIVVDSSMGDRPVDWATLGPKLCDRHYGIGADGLLLILPSELADFRMRIINADGSEPEMCGNGLRCFAYYLHTYGLTDATRMTVETGAGVLEVELQMGPDGHAKGVRVDMGTPRLTRAELPMEGNPDERVLQQPLRVGDRTFLISAVSMGNPHVVTFVEKLDETEFMAYGPLLEAHPAFPKRTNVEFVQVLNPGFLRVKVFERGVGPTMACGTGACATLVAAVLNGRAQRKAQVELPGGILDIEWAEDDHVYMTGPAAVVFTGVVDLFDFLPSPVEIV
ncbi:MAG TPA: diaminopimelate epimerase [Stenomitos sp.]